MANALSSITFQILPGATVAFWLLKVIKIVPEPYLDEVFHVRQAQAYWEHQWHVWDPKITTPPGLYLTSYLFFSVYRLCLRVRFDVQALRVLNALLFFVVTPFQIRRLLQLLRSQPSSDGDSQIGDEGQAGDEVAELGSIEFDHTILNLFLFPPLFFFSVLYYTDVLSASSILETYIAFLQRRRPTDASPQEEGAAGSSEKPRSWLQTCRRAATSVRKVWPTDTMLYVLSLRSLLFRQTNIFWVAIFLAGLEIIRVVKRNCISNRANDGTCITGIVRGSWDGSKIYDPLVRDACVEDYFKTAVSLVVGTMANLRAVSYAIIPYMVFLLVFGSFVFWNGGVVLGHKEFHTASLHLPQMLYIWPNFTFFSFPIIAPYVLNAIVPQPLLPKFLRRGSTRHRLPRPAVAIVILALMTATVHYNTIVHPFTLADNRHYTFYIFRILLRHPLIKYLAVPVYFGCGWGAIQALGGMPSDDRDEDRSGDKDGEDSPITQEQVRNSHRNVSNANANANANATRSSFLLIYLLTTTLSLITAPLVEPRYLIIPWLIWRLHLPSISPSTTPSSLEKNHKSANQHDQAHGHNHGKCKDKDKDYMLWLETVWFSIVNVVTCHIFLNWGFEWTQEPGKVQRFMW